MNDTKDCEKGTYRMSSKAIDGIRILNIIICKEPFGRGFGEIAVLGGQNGFESVGDEFRLIICKTPIETIRIAWELG